MMQRERSDITTAPVPPLRAEPRHQRSRDAEGHVRGVEASPGGLVRATLGSVAAAGAILALFWLPAEYGIDPTGLGRVTGLTQMGEIKQQLYAEAAAEDAALTGQPAVVPATEGVADREVIQRLAAIETQVAAIATVIGADAAAPAPTIAAEPDAPTASATDAPPPPADPGAWRDEVSYVLAPAEGVEVKLQMEADAVAAFAWDAGGAVLNHDTHGDGGGQKVTYEQGRAVPGQEGELVAAFAGNHGWFWRNRTDAPVTLTLRTRGDYAALKAP